VTRAHRLRGPLAASLLACLLLVAACGGDDGSGDSSDGSVPEGASAEVDASECPLDALESADGPVEITLWHAFITRTQEAIEDLAAEYNASQDQVVVNVESQGSGYQEIQRKFNQSIESGELPQIAALEDNQTQFLADSGVIVPADACLAAGGEEPDWLPAVRSNYTIEGVLWPSAFSVATPVLYYNRAHFEAAGLDPDDPPQTLDELRDAAQAIKDAGVGAVEAPFAQWLEPVQIESWLSGVGQDVVNEGNGRDGLATEATFDSDASVELLTWMQDMYEDGLMAPSADTDGQIDHLLAMASDQASFTIESSVAATSIEAFLRGELDTSQLTEDQRVIASDDLDLTLDIGAAPFPGLEEPGQAQVAGNGLYITNTGSPEQIAAAWDFLEFMNGTPAQVVNDLVGSWLPSVDAVTQDPELADVWETTLSGQWLALAYDQVLDTNPDHPGPSIGPGADFRQILRSEIDRLLFEDASPEDVSAAIQEQLQEALEVYEEQNF
jgi:sn-glycerol 3-phosphate transport system substrate-binding protein